MSSPRGPIHEPASAFGLPRTRSVSGLTRSRSESADDVLGTRGRLHSWSNHDAAADDAAADAVLRIGDVIFLAADSSAASGGTVHVQGFSDRRVCLLPHDSDGASMMGAGATLGENLYFSEFFGLFF